MASEEAFRPLAATTQMDSGLKWRNRPSSKPSAAVTTASGFVPAGQSGKVVPAVAQTPVELPAALPAESPPEPAAEPIETIYSANRISSKQTRARMRDAVMQVNSYQSSDAKRADPPAAGDSDAVRDPFELDDKAAASQPPLEKSPAPVPPEDAKQAPAPPAAAAQPGPRDAAPGDRLPAMPDDEPVTPADDLFKDEPISPDAPGSQTPRLDDYNLSPGEEDQLLEGIGTPPGEPGCVNQRDECQKALRKLQQRDITKITIGLLIEGAEGTDFPCDCRLGRDFDSPKFAGRNFAPTLFTWKAAGTCHKPLYFEDVQLERYGHSWNPVLQPFMSGAHFFVSVPLLPYKMGLRPYNECVYSLGYYRPGSCAPYMFDPIPLSLRAAVFEGFGAAAFAFWFWPPR